MQFITQDKKPSIIGFAQLHYLIKQSLKSNSRFCDQWHADNLQVAVKMVTDIRQILKIPTVREQNNERRKYEAIRKNEAQYDIELMPPSKSRSQLITQAYKDFWNAVDKIQINPDLTLKQICDKFNLRINIVAAASIIIKAELLNEVGTMSIKKLRFKARDIRSNKKNNLLYLKQGRQRHIKRSIKGQKYIDIYCANYRSMTIEKINKIYNIPLTQLSRLQRIMRRGKLDQLMKSDRSIYYFDKRTPLTRSVKAQKYIDIYYANYKTMTVEKMNKVFKIPFTPLWQLQRIMRRGKLDQLVGSERSIYYFYKRTPSTRSVKAQKYIDIYCANYKTMTVEKMNKVFKIPFTPLWQLQRIMRRGKLDQLVKSDRSIYYFDKRTPSTPYTRKHGDKNGN